MVSDQYDFWPSRLAKLEIWEIEAMNLKMKNLYGIANQFQSKLGKKIAKAAKLSEQNHCAWK